VNTFAQSDGLNIFFTDPNSQFGSRAGGNPSNYCFIRGTFQNSSVPQALTDATPHEIGHCLGLHHTYKGLHPLDNQQGSCAELVNGSNCDSCGDYVCDTPPDRGAPANEIYINSDCTYNWDSIYYIHVNTYLPNNNDYLLPFLFDANGDTINPDLLNMMGNTYHYCKRYISLGQAERMRNVVANTPLLQACLSSGSYYDTPSNFDLMIKTDENDVGTEPYQVQKLWKSPDIWIRNSPDGFDNQVHQSPIYDSVNPSPVYVYVKVRNIGCQHFDGTGYLKLYWAKAATALAWPGHWINNYQNGIPMGDIIDSVPLPLISGKDSVVFEFEWHLENPEQYVGMFSGQQPWHYCLLARIVSNEDPMNVENRSIHMNVAGNNNIAWKNVYLVYPSNLSAYYPGGVIAIGSVEEEEEATYNFTFSMEEINQHFLTDEAEVIITLDDSAWEKWDVGGRICTNIDIYDEENKKLVINHNDAKLGNMTFPPGERNTMSISFNFLTEEVTEIEIFDLDVYQRYSGEELIVGGETYVIIKDPDRILFYAEGGGDKFIDKGDSTELSANYINENVVYMWRDGNSVISTEKDFTAKPETTTSYIIEIIAEDGYKDYDTVVVYVKNNVIKSINPNPAEQVIAVEYIIDDTNFSLYIVNSSGNVVSTNMLPQTSGTITIGISTITSGNYYCQIRNGLQILDTKPFIKQ
jgi:hypothetical protein